MSQLYNKIIVITDQKLIIELKVDFFKKTDYFVYYKFNIINNNNMHGEFMIIEIKNVHTFEYFTKSVYHRFYEANNNRYICIDNVKLAEWGLVA